MAGVGVLTPVFWATTVAAGPATSPPARPARLSLPGANPVATADEAPDMADASARGTAGDLVLAFYGRIPMDSLKLDGVRRLFDQLLAWDPDA
ncbi:hypothetical protein ACFWJS_23525 [Streptomyces sp. NPDC127061]|uniref:hypothetical protein n=1 Tax=unclassified Streptomyces TaxID=2593676 RepID=UPI002250D0E0|nr:hypothetical protein [Streptomyces sp. NBC_00439]MCX5098975.1 hypothetical protein [Streptomyces sp. NBC_00439]